MPTETSNQKLVREKLDEFSNTFLYGRVLRTYLERSGVQIVEAKRRDGQRWRLVGVLPEHIRNIFDVRGDVLIFATSYERVQPRILSEMQGDILRDTRFDNDLCILATADKSAAALAHQRAGELAVLTISPDRLIDNSAPELRSLIASLIGTIDHFNVTTIIFSPPAFFGRSRMIRDITKELHLGAHVGVFGLRKAGKSSLLAQVRTLLVKEGWIAAWLDLGNYVGSAPNLLRDLIVELASKTNSRIHLDRSSSHRDIETHWQGDFSTVCHAGAQKRLLLVLDEFDRVQISILVHQAALLGLAS